MSIIWSELAIERIEEIAEGIEQRVPEMVSSWIDELFVTVEKLDRFPRLGRMVPEVGREEVRELIWRRHRVIYQLEAGDVHVLTVLHTRQNLEPTDLEPPEES